MLEYKVREFSLSTAASIFYTSTKDERKTNIEALYKYINYFFFDIPHKLYANTSKDSLFIPSGFDNKQVLDETFASIKDKYFEDMIKAPAH